MMESRLGTLLDNRRTYRLMIESWTKRGDFYEVGMYEDK